MSSNDPCPECGARPRGPASPFCTYCGARLDVEASPAEARRAERDGRLAAIASHSGFAAAMGHSPDVRVHMAGGFVGVGCFGAFSVVTGLIALAALTGSTIGFLEGGAFGLVGIPFVIVPALMALFSGAVAIHLGRRMKRFAVSDFERRPAVVRDERVRTSDDSTTNFVTLEFEGGRREEFPVGGPVAGRVVRDDVGIAYIKGGFLVDFRRLDG